VSGLASGVAATALAVFLACLAGTAYLYFGYPLLLLVLGRLRPRPVRGAGATPPVTILVPAHNEAAVIGAKVANALALDYPPERLEVLVISDGSTDRTEEIVAALAAAEPERVRLLRLPRGGKLPALNRGAAAARGEVLVLTDANSVLAPDALRHLVSPFADPAVGGVCGNKRLRPPRGADATAGGEGLYWRYDKWLKAQESRIGSIFAADGGLYALRRELYTPIEDPAQADDIAISARVVLQGRRLLYEPRAVAEEDAPEEGRDELRRKVRVTNHSVRALLGLGPRLWTSGLYSLELLSHKLFRHLVPFLLLPMLAANAVLAFASPRFAAVLALHLGFYALAAAGFLLRHRPAGRRRPLYVPYYFTLVNLAAFLGVVSILRGERFRQWSPRQGREA
jgi:cellulose synthase/poly-beta-1,6-N-acetylglucosamine synthase-like glycosyltransferase